jgi:hypothetical protein
MTGISLPYRAVSDSTACPAVEAPGGGATGGMVATEGCTMVGCVNGAGTLGPAPAPDGAKFIAGAGSGTEAGGIGGGRSENSWAETGLERPPIRAAASQSDGRRRLPRPHPPMRLPQEVMQPCFSPKTRQIQASVAVRALAAGNRRENPSLNPSSPSSHIRILGELGRA